MKKTLFEERAFKVLSDTLFFALNKGPDIFFTEYEINSINSKYERLLKNKKSIDYSITLLILNGHVIINKKTDCYVAHVFKTNDNGPGIMEYRLLVEPISVYNLIKLLDYIISKEGENNTEHTNEI